MADVTTPSRNEMTRDEAAAFHSTCPNVVWVSVEFAEPYGQFEGIGVAAKFADGRMHTIWQRVDAEPEGQHRLNLILSAAHHLAAWHAKVSAA